MPSQTSLPQSISSMSDSQLLNVLRAYNFDAGPIVASTRAVYERKLFKLQTGEQMETQSQFPPADSDDEDKENSRFGHVKRSLFRHAEDDPVTPPVPEPPQPRPRTAFTERRVEYAERKREIRKPSPRKPLHPELGDNQYRTRFARKAPTASASKSAPSAPGPGRGTSAPLWVLAVALALLLVFFVYRNLESEPASSIPDRIEMEQ